MIWTVYALRLRGDDEIRYVGQTSRLPFARLVGHLSAAYNNAGSADFAAWLRGGAEDVEVVALSEHPTLREARAAEREAIRLHLAHGCRLFNHKMVPADRRFASAGVA